MQSVAIFSPAKLNLFLAITGRRGDGFHDLVSVAAPLAWGDVLHATAVEKPTGGAGDFSLTCDNPAVPVDETNLVLKAAAAFAKATADRPGGRIGAKFFLEKRIPMGAGLGGGSSNAVAALRALNQLAGGVLAEPALAEIAAGLGSDCALFVHARPVVMRGRGERIEALTTAEAARLRGRRVLVFKPAFGIATPWAYARMASFAKASKAAVATPGSYLPAAAAEARLAAWRGEAAAPAEGLLFNNMEAAAFGKFIALPALLAELRGRFGLAPRMSGSGSACFAFLPERVVAADVMAAVREAWGPGSFAVETTLA